jgi:hypothetical protein
MKRKLIFLIFFFAFVILNTYAQWSPEVKISTGAMQASLNEDAGPCLAVSNDTLYVVWSDHRTNGYAIYYDRSIDTGMTWSIPVPVTDTTGNATMPVVAVSGRNVHIVWMGNIQGVRASYYIRSLDGGDAWGPKVCLDSITAFWPGVATSGDTVVVTLNKDAGTGNTEVFIMISVDNGSTWGPEIRISNAFGRSEDPAIAVKGSFIHLSWNDNRTGTMQIYYRRSADGGVTWGAETQLTNAASTEMCYTSMVSLDGTNVDIPYGYRINNIYNVWIKQSADHGSTFGPSLQLTNGSAGNVYPYCVRDGSKLHLGYVQLGTEGGAWYLRSFDGGASWDSLFFLGSGLQPFLVYTGCMVHAIYPDSGQIYYRVNPTGNCFPTGMKEKNYHQASTFASPNPFTTYVFIKITSPERIENAELMIYTILGNEVRKISPINSHEIMIDRNDLPSGTYFYRILQSDHLIGTGKILAE